MSESGLQALPLFPLGTVLLPGGRLPLRIFEPRYLDMVRRCAADESPFGVVLIREGLEARVTDADVAPSIHPFGTSARIIDVGQTSDGALGIVAAGERRFAVRATWEQDDHLMMGRVQLLPPEAPEPVAPEYTVLLPVLQRLLDHPLIKGLGAEANLDDANQLAWRLTDLLPLQPTVKQELLQMNSVTERLDRLLLLVGPEKGTG